MGRAGYPRPVTTTTPPTTDLRLAVGYDGSPPAERALNAAVNLLQGRTGRIEVVYVAHMSSMAALSPAAVTELETDFDEIEQELRTSVGEQLRGRVEGWDFERRESLIAEELLVAEPQGDDRRRAMPVLSWSTGVGPATVATAGEMHAP